MVVQKQMQPCCGQRRVEEGGQDAPQLLLDAFADGALAETETAGYVESRHQRFALDEQQKAGDAQPAA